MSKHQFKQNIAVIIGINNYKNGIPALGTAKQDAEAIADILERDYHYKIHSIIDHQATKQQLQTLLNIDLPNLIYTPSSRLIFYFAGHGIALNGDEGPQGYLIPQDGKLGKVSTYLPMQTVETALSKLSCRHCFVILDCCFAGAFRWSSTRRFIHIPKTIHKERYDRFIQNAAWQVITSAGYDQTAFDNLDLKNDRGTAKNQTNHSPFATALMEALRGNADVYPPAKNGKPAGDGIITATELYLYLRDFVEIPTDAIKQRQTPQIWSLNKHDKGEFIFLVPGHPLNLPSAPSLDDVEENNPYRGLKSYEKQHSQLFFGRTALINQLCEFINHPHHPLTVVLGASGSGKSSLVKAGLMVYLEEISYPEVFPIVFVKLAMVSLAVVSGLPKFLLFPHLLPINHLHQWKTLTPIRPGESPLSRLNRVARELGYDSKPLNEAIALWSKNYPNQKLLLVIDQLEELITVCRDEAEKEKFLETLANLVQTHGDRLRIVLTLRSDFESQFSNTPLTGHWQPEGDNLPKSKVSNPDSLVEKIITPNSGWQAGRFIVPAMTRNDLREVIEEPTSAKVVYFQSLEDRGYLVDRLIDEVADMPGALPLLSFALSELYLKLARRYLEGQKTGDTVDRVITWQDYDELGGVIKSLTRRADEEYDGLVKENAAYETTIRHVMLRMVAIGGELARRRVYQKELVYPEPEYGRVKAFIKRFDEVRLLISGQDEKGEYVEPAHDALVTGWEKLLTWNKEEEETLILQRRLTPAAMEWDQVKDSYKTGLFDKANPVIDSLDRVLFPVENLLVKLIKLPADLMQKLRPSQHQQGKLREKPAQFLWNSNPYLDVLNQEINGEDNWLNTAEREFIEASVLQKRRNGSWRWRIAIAVMLGLSGLTIIAYIQQNLATKREKIAFARQLAAQSQVLNQENADLLIRNALLAVKSMQLGMEVDLRLFQAEQTLIQAKKLLPTPLSQFNLKDDDDLLNSQVALRANEDNIQLINPINGQVLETINCSENCFWNSNGKYLAKINKDGSIQIVDLSQNKEISKLSYINANQISDSNSLIKFSLNGKYFGILNLENKSLTIWDILKKQKKFISLHQDFQRKYRFTNSSIIDNKGNFFYIEKNSDNEPKLLKIDLQGKLSYIPVTFCFNKNNNHIVSFSANGRYLTVLEPTVGQECVQVLDVESGREILRVNTNTFLTDIAINNNGKYLAISDRNGVISIWDILVGKEVKKIQYYNEGWIGDVEFITNSNYLLSNSGKMTRIHEIPSGKEISRIIHDYSFTIDSKSVFSQDGKYLLTSGGTYGVDGTFERKKLKIWDLTDIINESENNDNIIKSKDLSSENVFDDNGLISPNQKYKAVVELPNVGKNTLKVIRIADGEVLLKKDYDLPLINFIFSSNNQYIAGYGGLYSPTTKTSDGVIQVWEIKSGKSVLEHRNENAILNLQFSLNSKYIIYSFKFSGKFNGIIDISTGQEVASYYAPETLIKDICRRLTRNLTIDEWKQYIGERKYQKICENLPVHPKSSL